MHTLKTNHFKARDRTLENEPSPSTCPHVHKPRWTGICLQTSSPAAWSPPQPREGLGSRRTWARGSSGLSEDRAHQASAAGHRGRRYSDTGRGRGRGRPRGQRQRSHSAPSLFLPARFPASCHLLSGHRDD